MTTSSNAATRRKPRGVPSPAGIFLRGFVKHPVMVGSVIPSSNRLIRKMLAPIDWANAKVVVEYGPGVGTFTRPILERLPADGTLITIDTNAEFTDYLRRRPVDRRKP